MYVSICVVLTAGVHVARGIDSVKLNGRSDQEVINVCAQLQTSHGVIGVSESTIDRSIWTGPCLK